MTKWHISKKGRIEVCRATVIPCPIGGDDIHFDSEAEGQAYLDKKFEEEFMKAPSKESSEETVGALNNPVIPPEVSIEKDTIVVSEEVPVETLEEAAENSLHELLLGGNKPVRYEVGDVVVERHFEKILDRSLRNIEACKRKDINVTWKDMTPEEKSKFKNKGAFEKYYEDNNEYITEARANHRALKEEYTRIIRQRQQAIRVHRAIKEELVDYNYSVSSAISASSYYVINARNKDKVKKKIEDLGFKVEDKTNKTEGDLLIRMSDHSNGNETEDIRVDFKRIPKKYLSKTTDRKMFELIGELKNTKI